MIRKIRYLVFWSLLQVCVVSASDKLDSALLPAVVRIEIPNARGSPGEVAGGFILMASDDPNGKKFLVTNKHVVGDWNYADGDIQTFHPWIDVFFYRSNDPSGQSYRATKINLLNSANGLDSTRVFLHPQPRIDLVLIDVTDKFHDPQEHIATNAFGPSYLVLFQHIKTQLTDIADEVIALGYPLGIRSLKNNYPIAKIGYLASTPGDEVSIPIKTVNRAGVLVDLTLEGKFLVVDGLIVPGNSGGPVVLMGGSRFRVDPASHAVQGTTEPIKNYVAGVVSLALGGGLTVVVSSDYLFELLQSTTAVQKPSDKGASPHP
jgi:hypothetical protein